MEETDVQEVQAVNNFIWIIKDYRSEDMILRRFRILDDLNKSMCWCILLFKKENNILTFQVENTIDKTFPDPVEMKLSIGTSGKQKVFCEIGKTLSSFGYSIENEVLLPFLSPDGSLHINLKINKALSPSIEEQSIINEAKNFKPFLNNRALSDVIFQIDEHEIPAHKIILASVSSVFNEMFSHQTETNISFVIIKETDPNVFKEFLSYIYTGLVANLENIATGLYDLANKYDIPDLRAICEEHLHKSLLLDNVISVLHLADRYNSINLKNKCIEYMDRHFEQVRETEPFKNLRRELLMDFLCATRMKKPRN